MWAIWPALRLAPEMGGCQGLAPLVLGKMARGLMASFPPAPSYVEPLGVGVSQPGRAEPGSSLSVWGY